MVHRLKLNMLIDINIVLSLLFTSVLVLFNEGHVRVMFGLLHLCIGDIDPREKTVKEEGKWILIHVYLLSLRYLAARLLIVLDVI
jgi:hypothetical protein